MRRGKLLSICLLSLFVFSIATPIALTKADFMVVADHEEIYQNKFIDHNEDKIDDKFMAEIINNADYYFDAAIKFDHKVTGLDLFRIGQLGAFCYDGTWDLGRRIKAHISRDILDDLAELPGIAIITSVDVRNIFVLIEGKDISGFDVLVQNFEGVKVLDALNAAMVPYYSGVENDIAKLGNFDAIADITDLKLEIDTTEELPNNLFSPDDSATNTAVNATGMWSAGYTGSGVRIGIVDTGINMDHVDIIGRIAAAQSFILEIYGYDHDDTTVEDVHGHGSHVAGIAAGDGTGNANAKGMAPNALIYMARVEPEAYAYSIFEGVNWLVKTKNVDIVNLSFGGPDDPGLNLVERVFRQCVRNYGVSITCVAGNSGGDQWYSQESPGSTPDIITVGAIDASGGLPYSMPYFTSWGLTTDNRMKPDVLAPGVAILSLGPGSPTSYATQQGTSMAAPCVAGAIALLIEAARANGINYNPGTIKSALMKTSILMDSDMDYLIQGRGYINVGKAWNYMLTAAKEGSKPIIGVMNPLKIPYSFWDPMVQGQIAEIYVTCVSPFQSNLDLSITGDATQFITIGDFAGEWTEEIKLTFAIPLNATIGSYTGSVDLIFNGTTILDTIEIDLNIVESNGNRILNNYRSTYRGDNHIFNGQYFEFCEDIRLNGYALSEQDIELNATMLANYEMVWFPDPYNIEYPYADKEYTTVRTYHEWSDAEIAALDDFVANGGTAFFDLLGIADTALLQGTNVTAINKFTDAYGIHVRDDIWTNPNTIMVGTVGENPLTKGVNVIDHYGCSLQLSGDAVMVTEYSPGSSYATCAYTQTAGGGRVIVLTTNFVLDTEGYQNNYQSGATQNDVFGQNIVRWGAAKNRIQKMNVTQVGKDIQLRYKYLKGDNPLFGGFSSGPTGNAALIWSEESPDVWVSTISKVKSGDYYITVECGEPGVDEYDYFVFTATGTGGIGLSSGVVVLISALGLASWYLISRRKKS